MTQVEVFSNIINECIHKTFFIRVYFTNSHLKVMEEDKKKEVLGNGLATESEPTAVVKVFCNFECSGVKI